MTLPRLPDKPLFDLILLALLLAVLFGFSLGARPYSAPSESRYVEIGREMAASGDYVTPRLDYVKYFEKPALFYWIQAQVTKHMTLSPATARIPTMCFAIFLCLITYGLGRTIGDRLTGWLGAITLATSLYLFALSRIVLLDIPVSVFIAGTLTAFLYVADAPEGKKRSFALYSMYAAAACAVLTKGLIGALLPGAVVFIWLCCTGRWTLLKSLRIVSGTALFLLICVPWHVMVAQRNPEFLHFYFIHEHWERYLTKIHGRYQPDWFFIVVLLGGLFPWVVFTPQALISGLKHFWQKRREDGKPLFLIIWSVFIFVFFSLSDSKLIPYILPIFPVMAALIGRYFANAWNEKPAPGFSLGLFLMMMTLIAMALAPTLILQWLDPAGKVPLALRQGGDDLSYLTIASMVCAVALLITIVQGRTRHVILCMFVIIAVVFELSDQVAAHYNKDSMKEISFVIHTHDVPGDEVATYETYYQDLPVYLARRVTLVNWKGELEFGAENENTSDWVMDDKAFWKRWMKGDHRMFVVMREETFLRLTQKTKPDALHLFSGSEDGRNIVFCNQPLERH